MKRRSFVRATAVAGAGALVAPGTAHGVLRDRRRADLVLRGGMVFDGTGAPGREMDVAVTGDRITEGPSLIPSSESVT